MPAKCVRGCPRRGSRAVRNRAQDRTALHSITSADDTHPLSFSANKCKALYKYIHSTRCQITCPALTSPLPPSLSLFIFFKFHHVSLLDPGVCCKSRVNRVIKMGRVRRCTSQNRAAECQGVQLGS